MFTARLTLKDSSTDPDSITLALWARFGSPPYPIWGCDGAGRRFINLGQVPAEGVARYLETKELSSLVELCWDTPRGLYPV